MYKKHKRELLELCEYKSIVVTLLTVYWIVVNLENA